jgi:predicted flavoprotein YhiN
LAKAVITRLDYDPTKMTNRFTKAERARLVKFLKSVPIEVKGLLGTEKAVVVSGGLDLAEVEPKYMRSIKYPNLYVVGDILDIDRPSGGYSLQLCWTTGWVAGTSAAQSIS